VDKGMLLSLAGLLTAQPERVIDISIKLKFKNLRDKNGIHAKNTNNG
jgi:hypothetical protein